MRIGKTLEERTKAVQVCRDKGNFLLLSHVSADGDAIGSVLALGLALKRMGKNVVMINPDGVPLIYRFLPGWDKIRSRREELSEEELAAVEVIITLDTANEERLGDWSWVLDGIPALVVNIDHHLTNSRYGHINWIEKASSTGEMVFHLLLELGWEVTADIALSIYTAIVTDTGSFRFDNTSSETHRHVAELLQKGINPAQVTEYIFASRPVEAVRLLGRALETLELSADGKIAWLTVTNSILERTGAARENINGIVNFAREIAGVYVGILFEEAVDNKVKVSLRSDSRVDVSEIAQKFGGGGHSRAAGCRVQGSLTSVKKAVLDTVAAVLARGDDPAGNY